MCSITVLMNRCMIHAGSLCNVYIYSSPKCRLAAVMADRLLLTLATRSVATPAGIMTWSSVRGKETKVGASLNVVDRQRMESDEGMYSLTGRLIYSI